MNSYEKFYKNELVKIEGKIQNLFKGREPKSLYEPCTYIMSSSGKRLRPFLVVMGSLAVGGKARDVYNAAVSAEVLHNFTLVHDDIMDNANMRRGLETLHIKYDVSTAILAGDNLIALAYLNLLKDCKGNSENVLKSFTQGIIEICEGQSYDKEFENRKSVSINEYLLMIQKKTAALAEMCCSIGGQIAGGTNYQIKQLQSYGRNLGMAFQLQDDLLDITADQTEFGKSIGGDLVEGKKTYLFLKALEKSKGKIKKDFLSVIKNKGCGKDEIPKFKKYYEELGILEDTNKEVIKYTNKAIKAINFIEDDEIKNLFIWLANALINRIK